MNRFTNKAITVGIFFSAAALLVSYLLSMRWQVYLPSALFWVAITFMVGTITIQILSVKLSSPFVAIVLIEVVVTCFMFHMLSSVKKYISPYLPPSNILIHRLSTYYFSTILQTIYQSITYDYCPQFVISLF